MLQKISFDEENELENWKTAIKGLKNGIFPAKSQVRKTEENLIKRLMEPRNNRISLNDATEYIGKMIKVCF